MHLISMVKGKTDTKLRVSIIALQVIILSTRAIKHVNDWVHLQAGKTRARTVTVVHLGSVN
jgi:hypothetical protein